jgi:hypothetical protein
MNRNIIAAVAMLLAAGLASAQPDKQPIDTTTPGGEKIRLFPDGHWEYVDGKKAEEQRTERAVEVKQQQQAQQEAQQAALACGGHAQGGGQIGLGRTICPGDPDYNRGSLNPKLR